MRAPSQKWLLDDECTVALKLDLDLKNLRQAYQRVANFPESDPQGLVRMIELRKAVEKFLETR